MGTAVSNKLKSNHDYRSACKHVCYHSSDSVGGRRADQIVVIGDSASSIVCLRLKKGPWGRESRCGTVDVSQRLDSWELV